MKQGIYEIKQNESIARDIFKLCLEGDTSEITAPGQFVNIKIDGFFLRRPLSVCDWDETGITLIYKVVGSGTYALSAMKQGQTLDLLVGLGNGFDITKSGSTPVLIGGGVGVPPLYGLAKHLIANGVRPRAILGFNNVDDVFCVEEFNALNIQTSVTTVDGSFGTKGFVTDVLNQTDYSYFYTCGPMPMFVAINDIAKTGGQFSFEERMGCGFGACMGCTCKTLAGNKRICVEGPVLVREEINWIQR